MTYLRPQSGDYLGGFRQSYTKTGPSVVLPNVFRDGPNGVFVPSTSSDWTALSLPSPNFQWNCQDLSGNLIPTIGSVAEDFFLGFENNRLYQQSISGWQTKTVGLGPDSGPGGWQLASANMAIDVGEAFCWLIYASVGTNRPTGSTMFEMGYNVNDSGAWSIVVDPNDPIVVSLGTELGGVEGTHTHAGLSTVHPYLVGRKAGSQALFFSDLEQITDTHNNDAVDTIMYLLSNSATPPNANLETRYMRFCFWKGLPAETVLSKSTLTVLNWPLSY